ncbi:MAG: serine hydrolase [Bacteroidetes bacterium]|nr:serine hydrolase [Bacteroidota bacterium]
MLNYRHKLGIILVVCFLFVGCDVESQPVNEDGYGWPGDTWPTSTPEAEGIDPAVIDSIVNDINSGEYGLIDAFMVIRHGIVVADHRFEQDYESIMVQYDTTDYMYNYDHVNWHPYLKGTMLHSLQSVSKSVTSAALGIAIDDGLIDGPRAPVLPFFDDYEFEQTDERKQALTLEDFLTMRAGIKWNTAGGYTDSTHSTIIMENSDEWIQYVLDQPMDAEPGTRYQYNDGASVLIGKIARVATGKRMDEWARERLFEPIGIDEFYWKITPDGEADTEGGLYLKTEDLARFGYLFLRNGVWNGEQIISEEWVKASTSPVVAQVGPQAQVGYGYQWWIPVQEDGRAIVFAGNGYGGQFVMVAPDYDIVVIFNGWRIHGEANKSSYRVLQDRILPASSVDD